MNAEGHKSSKEIMKVVTVCLMLITLGGSEVVAREKLRSPKDELAGVQMTPVAGSWHSTTIKPTHRTIPIRLRDRINPLWWPFNCDQPHAPADFHPASKTREAAW